MSAADLIEDLRRERAAFMDALDAVAPRDSWTTAGLAGAWSARELVAHVGYWTGHASEVIHLFEVGRIAEDDLGGRTVDEVNATVARIARSTPLETVLQREAASVEALLERLEALDPALLPQILPDGATLEAGIAEDASDHYREHGDELRSLLAERSRG
jgi:hypothetical protein